MLFGGGLIERGGLRAEFHVDCLAPDLLGPFEVRAVPLGRIAVAGALRLATLHHALQDGPLQEIVQLLEILPDLAEAGLQGGVEGWAGCFARRNDLYRIP